MKLPQTLIIESPDEELRKEFIWKLIKSNLCHSPKDGVACGVCPSCQTIERQNHPDLIVVTKDPDKKNISVKMIRENIIARINSRPLLSEIICVLIKNAQDLSIGAQNALLKTLEEPPSYVRIILSSDRANNLLPTIKSRSHIHTLDHSENFFEGDQNFIREIVDMDLIERFRLAKGVAESDKKKQKKDSYNSLKFVDDLIRGLRDMLRNNPNNQEFAKTVLADLRKILDGQEKIIYNTNRQLVLENLLIQTLNQSFYSKYL